MIRHLVIAALVLGFAAEAEAHTRSTSHAVFTVGEDETVVRVTTSILDLTADPSAIARLPARIRLTADDACPVVPDSFSEVLAANGWRTFEWRVSCAPSSITSDHLFDRLPGHVQLVRIANANGGSTHVVTARARTVELGDATGIGAFCTLGVTHILGGLDHLVFLLALLVFARRLSRVALVVTGFTVGHAVSIVLASLGVVQANVPVVEALIGLSIVLVATERAPKLALPVAASIVVAALLAPRGTTALIGAAIFAACWFGLARRTNAAVHLRWGVVALFGLVHGFGFATALDELGAQGDHLAEALLGFNAGIEAGQLLVLVPAFFVVRRYERLAPWLNAAAAALGAYWFVARLF